MWRLCRYLAYQNVHAPYDSPPPWECYPYPRMWNDVYGNMLQMLDSGVHNVYVQRPLLCAVVGLH